MCCSLKNGPLLILQSFLLLLCKKNVHTMPTSRRVFKHLRMLNFESVEVIVRFDLDAFKTNSKTDNNWWLVTRKHNNRIQETDHLFCPVENNNMTKSSVLVRFCPSQHPSVEMIPTKARKKIFRYFVGTRITRELQSVNKRGG